MELQLVSAPRVTSLLTVLPSTTAQTLPAATTQSAPTTSPPSPAPVHLATPETPAALQTVTQDPVSMVPRAQKLLPVASRVSAARASLVTCVNWTWTSVNRVRVSEETASTR